MLDERKVLRRMLFMGLGTLQRKHIVLLFTSFLK